jgi:CheY-like chemotaxis protein
MPRKSGLRFYREVKEDPELKDLPIVVVTGVTGYGGRPDDFERFLRTRKQIPPPEGFVAKPIEQEAFLQMIRELLGVGAGLCASPL